MQVAAVVLRPLRLAKPRLCPQGGSGHPWSGARAPVRPASLGRGHAKSLQSYCVHCSEGSRVTDMRSLSECDEILVEEFLNTFHESKHFLNQIMCAHFTFRKCDLVFIQQILIGCTCGPSGGPLQMRARPGGKSLSPSCRLFRRVLLSETHLGGCSADSVHSHAFVVSALRVGFLSP